MRNRFTVIIFVALSFSILGCSATSTVDTKLSRNPSSAGLGGTDWRLVSFQSMDDSVGTTRPEGDHIYSMRLEKDGSVKMQINCNRATGSWSAKPGEQAESGLFSFGLLAATRALCPPPSLDERIINDSSYVRSYLLKDGKLHLSLMADGGIYTWERVSPESSAARVPQSPEDGGPRNWKVMAQGGEVELHEQPDKNSVVVLQYKVGAILDNLGCQGNGAEVWCDVQQLGGGPRGFVSAKYLEPAVSPDGSVSRGPDDSALRAGEGKFDASGPIPCAWAKGQPMTQCEMKVARAGGGYATVVITNPEGRTRTIYFRMGQAIGADTSQADGYPEFHASKEEDLNQIKVGTERYEVPDAVVLGG